MTPEMIPAELVEILDARAGKAHSRTGPVLAALAEILTRFQARFLTQYWPAGTTPFGFAWGPARVERIATFDRGRRGVYRVVGVRTGYRSLDIYVSPTGRSVRVFLDHTELTP